MSIYARIEDGTVVEIIILPDTTLAPDPNFVAEPREDGDERPPEVAPQIEVPLTIEMAMHPSIASQCVPCGDNVQQGWLYNGKTFKAPPPPAAEVPPRLSFNDFMDLFTVDEQEAIARAAMADVKTKLWYDRAVGANFVDLGDDRAIAGTQALVDAKLLTAKRRTRVLKGLPPLAD